MRVLPTELTDWNFNSIKVRLELICRIMIFSVVRHFNSIKVRLEHIIHQAANRLFVFQFHKGTIRTGLHTSKRMPYLISIP